MRTATAFVLVICFLLGAPLILVLAIAMISGLAPIALLIGACWLAWALFKD